MFFTRAAMSSAKCVRLVEMMGLHRIDGDSQEMAPTLAPPTSWVDLEERRRAFWGAYCIDCHASIATGWPTLIDPNEVSVLISLPLRLPCESYADLSRSRRIFPLLKTPLIRLVKRKHVP